MPHGNSAAALPVPAALRHQFATLDQLAAIPEEEIWLAKQKSKQTRRAYKLDVRHFMRFMQITDTDALRQVDHRAVIAWERMQREQEGAAPSTIRRRLAALSSLFKHLVKHGAASRNPVVDVDRPAINRDEGSTAAFSKSEARKMLDAPPDDTFAGLRDRAILSVGLQVGFRRGSGLTVGSAAISGFLSALQRRGSWDLERRLIARPFPQPLEGKSRTHRSGAPPA